MLKWVLEVDDVQIAVMLGLEAINVVVSPEVVVLILEVAVLKLEIIVLEFEVTGVVQDARQLVIRMIPEPTSPSYCISTVASACNELLL